MNNRQEKKTINSINSPVAWFVVLERARQENKFDLAAIAMHELKRLGVAIKYLRNTKGDTHEPN